MPKRKGDQAFVTLSELESARASLTQDIAALQEALEACKDNVVCFKSDTHDEHGRIQDSLRQLTARLEESQRHAAADAAGARAHAEQCTLELSNRLCAVLDSRVHSVEELLNGARTEIFQSMDAFRSDASGACVEMGQAAREACDAALSELRQDLEAQVRTLAERAEKSLEDSWKPLAEKLGALQRHCEEQGKEVVAVRESASRALRRGMSDLSSEQRRLNDQLGEQASVFSKEVSRLEAQLQESAAGVVAKVLAVSEDVSERIESARTETNQELQTMDEEVVSIRRGLTAFEDIATRRVEWVIKMAPLNLKPLQVDPGRDRPPYAQYFSPRFDAAGSLGMQLELRIHGLDLACDDGNNCALALWAEGGIRMVFRLFVGSTSELLDFRFPKRKSCVTRRLCCWEREVAANGELRVGVEVLECLQEVISIQGSKKVIACNTEEDDEEDGNEDVAVIQPSKLECNLQIQRHLNHRVLEQVKLQLDYVRSCLVRTVEWRIEGGSTLGKYFPRGHAMHSRPFGVAGVEKVQMIFYPDGYRDAAEGFCSFFIFALAGLTMKCWLQAGSERRELSCTWEKDGYHGCVNFCMLASCVNTADDSVLLSLYIENACQDMHVSMKHAPARVCPHGSLGNSGDAILGAPLESLVKIQRVAGRVPPELEGVKIIPAFWPARSMHDLGAHADGRHALLDNHRRRSGSGESTAGSPSSAARGRSDLAAAGAAGTAKTMQRPRSSPCIGARSRASSAVAESKRRPATAGGGGAGRPASAAAAGGGNGHWGRRPESAAGAGGSGGAAGRQLQRALSAARLPKDAAPSN
eukprot:TRINITY_DN9152_c0_g2_i5.p1 TRINITY_DN9152_c0_g2~~TRINITY_DN9152_c0_g2_i5.p1  ORF type:complete len:812 (+),score=170.00 TRINITY_DN9152_c0_g2_i5:86-2521(+)